MLTPLGFSLLRQLADGQFHSGEDLAAKVGLTRARVSQVLKDAESAGLALERVKGCGYRLLEAPGFLDAKAVGARLQALRGGDDAAPRLAVEVVDQVDSTSSELLRRVEKVRRRDQPIATSAHPLEREARGLRLPQQLRNAGAREPHLRGEVFAGMEGAVRELAQERESEGSKH